MLLQSLRYFRSQKQFGNLVTYGFGQAFNLLTPILVVPYIVAICGEEGYGKVGIGMALSFFLIVFIDFGSDIVGTKQVAINRGDAKKLSEILATSYAARFLILLLVIAIALAAYNFLPYFASERTLFVFGIPILIGQFLNPTWFLQGVENFKWITFLNIVSKLIYLAGIFSFVSSPNDYVYANLWWGIGMIAANSIALVYVIRRHKISLSDTSAQKIAAQYRTGFPFLFSQIFVSMQLYAPILLIGHFSGSTMAGKFKIVEQVIVIFKTYIFLFFNYSYPRVCFLLETDARAGLRFWKLYNAANFVFVLFSMACLFLFARPIVAYFNPVAIDEITSLLRFAVLIPIAFAVTIPLKQLVLGWEYGRFYNRLTIFIVAAMLLMIVVLLPIYGIYGVLAAIFSAEILTATAYFATIRRRLLAIN